jgi:hypothetical protein
VAYDEIRQPTWPLCDILQQIQVSRLEASGASIDMLTEQIQRHKTSDHTSNSYPVHTTTSKHHTYGVADWEVGTAVQNEMLPSFLCTRPRSAVVTDVRQFAVREKSGVGLPAIGHFNTVRLKCLITRL